MTDEDAQFWGEHPQTDHRPRWTTRRLGMLWECPAIKIRRCEECGHTELIVSGGDWRFSKVFPRLEPTGRPAPPPRGPESG